MFSILTTGSSAYPISPTKFCTENIRESIHKRKFLQALVIDSENGRNNQDNDSVEKTEAERQNETDEVVKSLALLKSGKVNLIENDDYDYACSKKSITCTIDECYPVALNANKYASSLPGNLPNLDSIIADKKSESTSRFVDARRIPLLFQANDSKQLNPMSALNLMKPFAAFTSSSSSPQPLRMPISGVSPSSTSAQNIQYIKNPYVADDISALVQAQLHSGLPTPLKPLATTQLMKHSITDMRIPSIPSIISDENKTMPQFVAYLPKTGSFEFSTQQQQFTTPNSAMPQLSHKAIPNLDQNMAYFQRLQQDQLELLKQYQQVISMQSMMNMQASGVPIQMMQQQQFPLHMQLQLQQQMFAAHQATNLQSELASISGMNIPVAAIDKSIPEVTSNDLDEDVSSDLSPDNHHQHHHQSPSKSDSNNKELLSSYNYSEAYNSSKQTRVDWHVSYAALLEYCKEHGHCNIRQRDNYECLLKGMGMNDTDYKYEGRLGVWLFTQRQTKKDGKLSKDRDKLLQKLVDDGKLLWDASDMKRKMQGDREWPMHYAALLEYGKEYGHCNVPWSHTYECVLKGFGKHGTDVRYTGKLGSWLSTQRQSKKGHGGRLSPERQQMLQKLVDDGNLLWKMRHHGDYEWSSHYAALLEYCKEHGHCNVQYFEEFECMITDLVDPKSTVMYNGKLGEWLRDQRHFKSSQSEELLPEQSKLLQELVDEGKMCWDEPDKKKKPIEFDWMKHYYALRHYIKEHGNCNIAPSESYECDISDTDMNSYGGNFNAVTHSCNGGSESDNNSVDDINASFHSQSSQLYHYKHKLGSWLDNQVQAIKRQHGEISKEKTKLLQALVNDGRFSAM